LLKRNLYTVSSKQEKQKKESGHIGGVLKKVHPLGSWGRDGGSHRVSAREQGNKRDHFLICMLEGGPKNKRGETTKVKKGPTKIPPRKRKKPAKGRAVSERTGVGIVGGAKEKQKGERKKPGARDKPEERDLAIFTG